ncbi:hypothetical protein NPIL_142821, partial [Nephila pilipes]
SGNRRKSFYWMLEVEAVFSLAVTDGCREEQDLYEFSEDLRKKHGRSWYRDDESWFSYWSTGSRGEYLFWLPQMGAMLYK